MAPRGKADVKSARLVVIGASLGGAVAIQAVLESLPEDFAVPIVITQHRHRSSGEMLSQFFCRVTNLRVVDADDNMPIESRHVYLAPPDYHLLIDRGVLRLSVEEPVHYSRPSIDILFETAADTYRGRVIGVVLTGANADGAEGSRAIRKQGGVVIVQDPETAEAPAMPKAALPSASAVVPLAKIGETIVATAARMGA